MLAKPKIQTTFEGVFPVRKTQKNRRNKRKREMKNGIKITEATCVDDALAEALDRLIPQLSQRAATPSPERLARIVADPSSHLFAAVGDDGLIAGMATLVINEIPTGRKAWLEDVVVDENHRGQGIGRALVMHAVETARACKAGQIALTSNPSRTAARRLYADCGFEEAGTTVFKLNTND